jgi:DNA mismatch repair protein MutL
MLQQALLAPFRQLLLPGQFPALALYLEIDPAQLDVNVHPTKTEVRFLDSRRVFQAIHHVAESLIAEKGGAGFAAGNSMRGTGLGEPAPVTPGFWSRPPTSEPAPASGPDAPQGHHFWSASETATRPDLPVSSPIAEGKVPAPGDCRPRSDCPEFSTNTFAGVLFNTYILFDLGAEVFLVDQHAAHERVRYETLRASLLSGERPMPQALLIPEAVRFPVESKSQLEGRLEWLARIGFECELFGEDTVVFRALPAQWGTDGLKTRLKSLVERVLSLEDVPGGGSGHHPALDEGLFEKLASEACHSSVRAGDRLEREEALSLVNQLFRSVHPWNCPHGRPTTVRVPKARFEEWFQRRV